MVYYHLPNPKPGHTADKSGRPSALPAVGRGGADHDRMPTGRFAQETSVLPAPANIDTIFLKTFGGSTYKQFLCV